ncbi:diol dehydratase small subunit [Hoeflea prorocentri]|uniref:Diol dehydratase small subunit n=1 Tax=Hoeflea prorocentri TaxID=1922333 RepID=A0A9X3UMN5_9HYPH|nr:diol dehydratase small subunit [Hoeflea prorocentri]MCY6381876.1 diol dehydratase small subunit [Hoeflea prorocentri]MDA5399676.1 diol dehydratase small subunit [Hoeflea prorocentri]
MNDASKRNSYQFPLGKHHRSEITTKSGRPLEELGIEQVSSGQVDSDDVSVSAETLELQAAFARESGYAEVAANLTRAAEMTRIPNSEILEIYEALRPGRSTYYELLSVSQRVASMYSAQHTAAYIREAADAYRDTGMLKVDEK